MMMTAAPSAYELQRLANIKRNEARLKELGLGAGSISSSSNTSVTSEQHEQHDGRVYNNHSRKRKASSFSSIITGREPHGQRVVGNHYHASSPPSPPPRRSLRNLGVTPPNYKESIIDNLEKQESTEAGSTATDDAGNNMRAAKLNKKKKRSTTTAPPVPADSSRNLDCDVALLLGTGAGEYLGKPMPATGKATVMHLACKQPTATSSIMPRFSKYSGVVEWKNAVVLWVNVGGKDYNNTFTITTSGTPPLSSSSSKASVVVAPGSKGSRGKIETSKGGGGGGNAGHSAKRDDNDCDGGGGGGGGGVGGDVGAIRSVQMTWFAGSRHTADTHVIRRILKSARADRQMWLMTPIEAVEGEKGTKEGLEVMVDGVKDVEQDAEQRSVKEKLEIPATRKRKRQEMQEENKDKVVIRLDDDATLGAQTKTAEGQESHKDSSKESRPSAAEDLSAGPTAADLILLCRLPGEPYVCCGRLKYVDHDATCSPLKFTWELEDIEQLRNSEDFLKIVQCH